LTLLAALLLPAWIGVAVAGACGAFARSVSASGRVLGAIVALPVGLGLTSALAFAWMAAMRQRVGTAGEVGLELLLAALVSIAWWARRGRHGGPQAASPSTPRPAPLLVGLGSLALATGLWRLFRDWMVVTWRQPLGGWDAVAIWNLKARFLASAEGWSRAFSSEIAWSHPDYPLLLPAFFARTWIWLGDRSWVVPAATGLAFLLLAVALATVSVYRLRGPVPALVAGVLVCGVAHTSLRFHQYADMPLAFWFLAVNVLLLENAVRPRQRGTLVFAGLAAGAMVWTKNEGWAMLLALLASEAITAWRDRLPAGELRARALAFGAGLAPLAATTVVFKLTLAPTNDLVEGVAWGGLADAGRLATIASRLASDVLSFGPFRVSLAVLVAGLVLVMGAAVPPALRSAAFSLALRLAGVMAAYGFTFAVTPRPLEWHLATTVERLLSHLFPSAVLLATLAMGPIGDPALQPPGEPPHRQADDGGAGERRPGAGVR